MNDTPQVLLEHYLKQLRLPTSGARVSQAGRAVRQRRSRHLRTVPAAPGRVGDAGSGTAFHGAAHQIGPFLSDQESGDLQLPGTSKLNKKLVVELARGEWITRRDNVLALGNSDPATFCTSLLRS